MRRLLFSFKGESETLLVIHYLVLVKVGFTVEYSGRDIWVVTVGEEPSMDFLKARAWHWGYGA